MLVVQVAQENHTKLLRELITRCSLQSLSSDSPAVVVTAPTGVAVFNIDGVTIRCALNLLVQLGNNSSYYPTVYIRSNCLFFAMS